MGYIGGMYLFLKVRSFLQNGFLLIFAITRELLAIQNIGQVIFME
jgi:hypothetical protein